MLLVHVSFRAEYNAEHDLLDQEFMLKGKWYQRKDIEVTFWIKAFDAGMYLFLRWICIKFVLMYNLVFPVCVILYMYVFGVCIYSLDYRLVLGWTSLCMCSTHLMFECSIRASSKVFLQLWLYWTWPPLDLTPLSPIPCTIKNHSIFHFFKVTQFRFWEFHRTYDFE